MARSWLKKARLDAGKTLAEIGKELEISESYYARIEAGERQNPMDITLCAKLSKIFSIPIQQIVELEDQEETA